MSKSHALELDELQRDTLEPLFRRFAALRMFGLPIVFSSFALLFADDASSWRRWLLLACISTPFVVFVLEYRLLRRNGFDLNVVPRNILYFIPIFPSMLFVTGGLDGPIAPMGVILTLVHAVVIRGGASAIFATCIALSYWAAALCATHGWLPDLIPGPFGGGARARQSDLLLYTDATVLSVLVLFVSRVGLAINESFFAVFQRLVIARDDALGAQREFSGTLTTLTGEIAHELKNPLASVKGLGALIAKDLEGKPAERLVVLRREVDRMQEILDQFLNFSRPLLPLTEEDAHLGALCASVVQLHEGLAAERRVELRLREDATVHARCDPRKIRQILINLVQNAVDASPEGSAVELVVEPSPGHGARIEILDRGAGIDPLVASRLFEPGVTSKEKGSGLGLAVARLLARQHGGDLMLQPREGGGTMAVLVLPPRRPEIGAPS